MGANPAAPTKYIIMNKEDILADILEGLNLTEIAKKRETSRANVRYWIKKSKIDYKELSKTVVKVDEKIKCQFCSKENKNKNALLQHEVRCKQNPNRKIIKPSFGMLGKKGLGIVKNQFSYGAKVSSETKEKLSAINKGKKWSSERKEEHSLLMQRIVLENEESYAKSNVSGRVKQKIYKGLKLKGSWEEKVAIWLDSQNIVWEYESQKFSYIFENKTKLYFPDFYLPEQDLFLEVKGFITPKDNEKWSQFPKKLIVIDTFKFKNIIEKNESFCLLLDSYPNMHP